MAIIESPPPQIVGRADLSNLGTEAADFEGKLKFTVTNGVAAVDKADGSEDLMLIAQYETLWQQTDDDFRTVNGLHLNQPVQHELDILNDSNRPAEFKVRNFLRRLLGYGRATTQHAGLLHVDPTLAGGTSRRYTCHTTIPTEFYLGEKWFVPINPIGSNSIGGAIIAILGAGINIPFLIQQSNKSFCFQPAPNDIARVENQVHKRPRRVCVGIGAGKLLLDDVYLPKNKSLGVIV